MQAASKIDRYQEKGEALEATELSSGSDHSKHGGGSLTTSKSGSGDEDGTPAEEGETFNYTEATMAAAQKLAATTQGT